MQEISNANIAKVASIFISNNEYSHRIFLGLPLWKRVCLTCQQAGIEHFLLISHNHEDLVKYQNMWEQDKRLSSKMTLISSPQKIPNITSPFICLEANSLILSPFDMQRNNSIEQIKPAIVSFLEKKTRNIEELYREKLLSNIFSKETPTYFGKIETDFQLKAARNFVFKTLRTRQMSFLDRYVNSIISLSISHFLLKTPITPNQVTIFTAPIAFVICYLFAQGTYTTSLCAAILAVVSAILDCCDGDIARLKFLQSKIGAILDLAVDNLINLGIFIGIAIGYWQQEWVPESLLLLLVGGFGVFAATYLPNPKEKAKAYRGTVMEKIILLLVSRDFVYLVLIFAIWGKSDLFLLISGMGSIIFATILFALRLKLEKTR